MHHQHKVGALLNWEYSEQKCLDDNVCITQIKKYFTFDGWSLLQNSIDTLLVHGNWTCSICCIDLSTSESIGCDGCLGWFHALEVCWIEERS